ncbi:MAG: tetratricopeptide repeat protein [Bacteroidales bacterium]
MRKSALAINIAISILLLTTSTNLVLGSGVTVVQQDVDRVQLEALYTRALTLHQKGEREEAAHLYTLIIEREREGESPLTVLAKSRLALIAIEMGNKNWREYYHQIERLYPHSPLLMEIRLKYAQNLFDLEEYQHFLEIDRLVNSSTLRRNTKNQYLFQRGYSRYKVGNISGAKEDFQKVLESSYNSYTNPSHYYLAYLLYTERDFVEAISHFNSVEGDERFSLLAQYYILESNYMLGNHLFVTDRGEQLYTRLAGAYQRQSARLISESFFALNNIDKAQFYFDKYSISESTFSRGEYYYAAILAYSRNNYQDAVELFKGVTPANDSLTQNSAYHLGRCYIELKNKIEALHSFKVASQLPFDRAIEEDASFNYAKLSFDLNRQIAPFQSYLERFTPSTARYNEIQNYIANYYLINKEYTLAIKVLSQIKEPTELEYEKIQKASFLRAIELVEIGAFSEAIKHFNYSLERGANNSPLFNLTLFWLAEAHYRKGEYTKSIEENLRLVTAKGEFRQRREWPLTLFNLGYSYFKLEQYDEAQKWFKQFLQQSPLQPSLKEEATIRLGDCLYMAREYEGALANFTNIPSKSQYKEYASYQESLIRGLLGDDKTKGNLLKELVANNSESPLYPQILYELSRTLVRMGKDIEAEGYLNNLIDNFESSHYYPKALLELGMINVNRNNSEEAIEYYKKLLEGVPDSPEAESAIAGLENIYREQGKGELFLSYIDGLGISQSRTPSQRELILFSSAEKLYLNNNYSGAIVALKSFIREFPEGSKSAHALFYLGESYRKTDKIELALEPFLKVMEMGEISFTEIATLNYANISYSLQNYREASQAYSSLSRIARLEGNKIAAAVGLARSYYMDKQFRNAVATSKEALKLELDQQSRLSTNFILGRSLFNLGEREEALKTLLPLSFNKNNKEGAESSYLVILEAFDRGDYEKVERESYSFSNSQTPHYYWLAKSFILLGDTFAERENWEQAEATYNSILDSYRGEEREEIKELIEMRLHRIEEIKKEVRDEKIQ